MKTAVDAAEAVKMIEAAAEVADHAIRHVERFVVGKVAGRQGDVYFHMVAEGHPHGKVRVGDEARKLAVGAQMGARHIAEPPAVCYEGTTLPATGKLLPNVRPVDVMGPYIESPERFVVTHPEHAHVSLPAGTYQVQHQVDARTQARVQD